MTFFPEEPKPNKPKHDPGGSRSWPIPHGMSGEAAFSKCGRYRYWLGRWFQPEAGPGKLAVWIGMNPSTADGKTDDPTVRWEMIYSQRELNCLRYVKLNVCDYRATFPLALLQDGVKPCSKQNLAHIFRWVSKADIVVCAWGKMHPSLRQYVAQVESLLAKLGVETWCLGTNMDGSPCHPLYLKRDSTLVPLAFDHGSPLARFWGDPYQGKRRAGKTRQKRSMAR